MRVFKLLFIGAGLLFMGIGLIGVVIPILPTTPFIILASVCFAKGSDRFDIWLKGTRVYKDYAEDFLRDRSMTFKRKTKLMILSDLMLAFPLIKLDNPYMKVFIIGVVMWKYWYFIFKIKTRKE